MIDKNLEKNIVKIIMKTIKKKINISPDDSLLDLGISSLKMVLILGQIEELIEIDIPQNELLPENFSSLSKIVETIKRISSEENIAVG